LALGRQLEPQRARLAPQRRPGDLLLSLQSDWPNGFSEAERDLLDPTCAQARSLDPTLKWMKASQCSELAVGWISAANDHQSEMNSSCCLILLQLCFSFLLNGKPSQ